MVYTFVSIVNKSNLVRRRVYGITFIRYAQNQKIEKPNNLKFWEQ